MAVVATINIDGTITGLQSGTHTVLITTTSTAAITSSFNLASGFNSIPIPAGMTRVIFRPPVGNTQTLTLKGVTADTGLPLDLTDGWVLKFASGTASFGITAGAAVSNCETIFF